MYVRGRNNNGQRSQKKFDLACQLMQLDYIAISAHSNMFVNMTKQEEYNWEMQTRNEYYENFTATQLEKMLELRRLKGLR